jgi:hypothetical protein
VSDDAEGWRAENDRHRALYVVAVKERDRLRAILDTLSKQAVEAEGQENVDDYDQGNVDAWRYVRLYIEREQVR